MNSGKSLFEEKISVTFTIVHIFSRKFCSIIGSRADSSSHQIEYISTTIRILLKYVNNVTRYNYIFRSNAKCIEQVME